MPGRATLARLAAMERAAGFALGAPRVRGLLDTYVDTADGALRAAGWACRYRQEGARVVAALKAAAPSAGEVHRRTELEVRLDAVLPPARWPDSEARRTVIGIAGTAALRTVVALRQERSERTAADGAREAAVLSFDEVVAEGARGARTWQELEIELLPGGSEGDLAALSAWASAQPGVQPSLKSKLERALDGS